MRTQTLTIYSWPIEEHPNKEAVLDTMRTWPDVYSWGDENVQSLKGFCDHFGLSGLDYSVSTCSHSWARAAVHFDLEELRGVRLWKWLTNNLNLDYLLAGNCPFTGYCFDESLLDPIREFIKKPRDIDYQELINDCLQAWVDDYVEDWEHAYSAEALEDDAIANNWHFTEHGDQIKAA